MELLVDAGSSIKSFSSSIGNLKSVSFRGRQFWIVALACVGVGVLAIIIYFARKRFCQSPLQKEVSPRGLDPSKFSTSDPNPINPSQKQREAFQTILQSKQSKDGLVYINFSEHPLKFDQATMEQLILSDEISWAINTRGEWFTFQLNQVANPLEDLIKHKNQNNHLYDSHYIKTDLLEKAKYRDEFIKKLNEFFKEEKFQTLNDLVIKKYESCLNHSLHHYLSISAFRPFRPELRILTIPRNQVLEYFQLLRDKGLIKKFDMSKFYVNQGIKMHFPDSLIPKQPSL